MLLHICFLEEPLKEHEAAGGVHSAWAFLLLFRRTSADWQDGGVIACSCLRTNLKAFAKPDGTCALLEVSLTAHEVYLTAREAHLCWPLWHRDRPLVPSRTIEFSGCSIHTLCCKNADSRGSKPACTSETETLGQES